MAFKMECPHCMRKLNVTEKAFGKTVPCPGCNQPIEVPHSAARLSSAPLPTGMPPVPDDGTPAQPPSDPLAFLRYGSATMSSSPPFPAGMPPIPQTSEKSDSLPNPAELLTSDRSTAKAKGVAIRKALTRALEVTKKRVLVLKRAHEAKNLQAAIDAQLETLGVLTLTHRPSGVGIGDELAELSHLQDGLSQKQNTLDSLCQTKGSGSVVKELHKEVAQLRVRQKALMVAVGRKAFSVRPNMPDAAGCYAALDRLQSSLQINRGQSKAIEDSIGPMWRPGRVSFNVTKQPLLVVGAAAGILLLLFLLWELAAGLLGSGYRVDYRIVAEGSAYLEVRVAGKAAKLAVMLTDPKGETRTEIIEENEMITNLHVVKLFMSQPEPETYTLRVKTFQPEEVVYEASPKFTRGKLSLLDVEFKWKRWSRGQYPQPEQMTIIADNQGDLPVYIDKIVAAVGDHTCTCSGLVRLDGRRETITVSTPCFYYPTPKPIVGTFVKDLGMSFAPGTYPAHLKLYVKGAEGEVLTFEKNVTVPPEEADSEETPRSRERGDDYGGVSRGNQRERSPEHVGPARKRQPAAPGVGASASLGEAADRGLQQLRLAATQVTLPQGLVGILAALSIFVGLIECLFGYRIFMVILALVGFLLGAVLAGAIGYAQSHEALVALLSVIVGGFIGAVMMLVLYFVGVFVVWRSFWRHRRGCPLCGSTQ